MKFRTHELFLGVFLSVAVFAMGMLFASSTLRPARYVQHATADQREEKGDQSHQAKSLRIPEDATGFFTFWIAAFTAVLAISTILLWRSTRNAALAGERQLEIIKTEFISTHRPRLRIRSIDRTTSSPTDYIGVKFAVVNVGDTEVHLLGSWVVVDFFPEKPPIDFNGLDVVEPRRFLPGASDSYAVTSNRKWLILQSEYNAARHLFVHGQIVYRNDLGTTYTTSFCRIWNVAANRFKRTDDPDYEYED